MFYRRRPGHSSLKHDLVSDRTQLGTCSADKALGEFVFQPSSPQAAEDDGGLMGHVYDWTDDPRRPIPGRRRRDQAGTPDTRRISRQLATQLTASYS